MNPAFRFARAGKVYKELEADEGHLIAGFLRTGVIGSNDDYWMPGMTEWKKVFSRDWAIPKPAPAAPPTAASQPAPSAQATRAASAAEAAQASAASAATVSASRTHYCECTACKKGFATPAKSVSGYSVIGQAAKFFAGGIALMILIYVLKDILLQWSLQSPSRVTIVMSSVIIGLIALAALCLFLMALFELIAAAVTHGIYRANPESCPFCNSQTFTKKA